MTITLQHPRYQFDRWVAAGGMGEVWQATDTLLDREVAVKVLRPELAQDPVLRARFAAEARPEAASTGDASGDARRSTAGSGTPDEASGSPGNGQGTGGNGQKNGRTRGQKGDPDNGQDPSSSNGGGNGKESGGSNAAGNGGGNGGGGRPGKGGKR